MSGTQPVVVSGTASGESFTLTSDIDLGDTAPVKVDADPDPVLGAGPPRDTNAFSAVAPQLLIPAVVVVFLGIFLMSVALAGPTFRSKRSERLQDVEAYGFGRARQAQKQAAPTAVISESLVHMGDQIMEGRESTTKTMALLERADLPWRAGEWLVLRLLAMVIAAIAGGVLWEAQSLIGAALGAVLGFIVPPVILRFLAARRARKFETILPDVMMLVATSLSSGFSLLQALDSVAKDAPEPAAKEFSRALAEARIGSDVSDALDHMAVRLDSPNMRWTTMAIRIQREVGGNLAETLRTTAATLREREMLKRQVKALSAEGRLSAYILVALPIGLFFYSMWTNYEYVSLLWTRTLWARHARRRHRVPDRRHLLDAPSRQDRGLRCSSWSPGSSSSPSRSSSSCWRSAPARAAPPVSPSRSRCSTTRRRPARWAATSSAPRDRLVAPFQERLRSMAVRLSPAGTGGRIGRSLDKAGNPAAWTVERVMGAKGLALLIGPVVVLAVMGLNITSVLVAAAAAAVGFFIPDLLVYNLGLKRQKELGKGLADSLDMLTVCVEAGQGFDAAILQVARTVEGPIAGEFARVLSEMQIGKSRGEAFSALGDRTTAPEVKNFVSTLVQADRLGLPIAAVLREQTKEMRVVRRQKAEEAAQKVTVKILFPLLLCIFPALFIVIIGPGAIKIVDAFSGGGL